MAGAEIKTRDQIKKEDKWDLSSLFASEADWEKALAYEKEAYMLRAETLGVDISDLLTGESPKLRGYILTRNGKGLAFDRRKQYHYQHLAYNFSRKLAEPFIVTVEKDQPGVVKQAHSHEGQEFDYVLEGYLRIILGGNELLLAPGDSVYYDSSLPHVMYAPEGDCRFIAVVIKTSVNE